MEHPTTQDKENIMWAYVKDGVIKQINGHQTRLQPNPGVYFSAKYADEWTKEQKENYGVYEIVQDKTNYKDSEYYINGADTISFGSGKVTRVWASATAKSLADVNWTQAEIDAGKGPSGADTVDKLAALYVYTKQEDKSVTRPLGEWPKLEDY